MYLVVIAWIYVVLMMSVAEATNTTGTVLGAIVTFVLYGLLPVALVVYLMGSPARNRAIKKRNAEEMAQAQMAARAALSADIPNAAAESAVTASANAAPAFAGELTSPAVASAAASVEPDAGRHPAGAGEPGRGG